MKEDADKNPSFWPNYVEPTRLARAIQQPLNDPNWINKVVSAYSKTKFKQETKNAKPLK